MFILKEATIHGGDFFENHKGKPAPAEVQTLLFAKPAKSFVQR